MKFTEETKWLLIALENEIGKETYNPNSYDGWTGDEGCSFRYPITIPLDNNGNFIKMKYWENYEKYIFLDGVTIDKLKEMRYKFGSNELYIGRGILNMLNFLEERYNLSFEELEKQLNK